MWFSTVRTLMAISAAISLFVNPRATETAIPFSRSVRLSSRKPLPSLMVRPIKRAICV